MPFKEWNPGKLLQTSNSYWAACALHAGVELDVFSCIGDAERSAEEVSAELQADLRATTMLLDALAAMALLEKRGHRYANTDFGKAYLVKASEQYLGYLIRHHHYLVASWSKLDQAVKTGKPTRDRASRADSAQREAFLMGMFNTASMLAPRIANEVDLSGRTHLLDLGGGPGTYAIHFCRKYRELRATVCDLPTTRPFAEQTIARFGLSDRIGFAALDYLADEIEGRYDAAWLSHILHSEGPDACRAIMQKVVGALAPGGVIAIHEFILENTLDAPVFPALFSLNMLLGTPEGRSYSEKQIAAVLSENGVKDIHRLPFRGPTHSSIMLGIV